MLLPLLFGALMTSAAPAFADGADAADAAGVTGGRDTADATHTADAPTSGAQPPPATGAPWCAPELTTLPGEVCAFTPANPPPGPQTLLIFLHGVIQPGSGWQWAQQRGAARVGARYALTVLMPRGRRGIGPRTMEDWWTWPTAATAQRAHEDAILAEWTEAQKQLEQRAGRPFDRVLVFGFSNGAYYATSLAMRGRLPVQGYAVFAGGSGAPYLERTGKSTKQRAPIFVGWGQRDRSHRDQVALARMLKRLHWPSRSLGLKRAGHAMTDAQVAAALRFLMKKPAPADRAPARRKARR